MERLFDLDMQLVHDVILLAIAVFFLFLAMSYLLFNPVRKMLEDRKLKIRTELDDAATDKADAAALKAAKATFGTFIPVVGSILADASEAVLVGTGVLRSAMGIYGILAILAVFLEPFCRIGIQYLILRLTASLCAMFGTKTQTALIADFGEVMRMLLGMTGAMCILLLVSTVCFLKGVG